MSTAFLRESDLEEKPVQVKRVSPLPPGAKNLMTLGGRDRLRQELLRLVEIERPKLAAGKEEAKPQLDALDDQIRYLQQSLQSAEVVEPPPPGEERTRIRFGAQVSLRDKKGVIAQYRLVGVDETDAERGRISFISPLARALTKARIGQKVELKTRTGSNQLEVTAIDYPSD